MRRVLLALVLLVGCTAGEKVTGLREGMTPDQVVSVMGRPDGQQRLGNLLGYTYSNRLMSGWSWDKADYYVIFQNDRLTSWGPGAIRPAPGPAPSTFLVVPLR